MNSTKAWYIITVIALAAFTALAGAALINYVESHMQDRVLVSCLKVQGTDLAYCKNLAAQVKL